MIPTFDDSMARTAGVIRGLAEKSQRPSAFCLGQVQAAGQGVLIVEADGLTLDVALGDLQVSVLLDYHWIDDNGEPNKLRRGDIVVLLSLDKQSYALAAKVR